jgi:sugar O-acyltransferase (sialic acid O-acetyltransferase NeuD family)
MSARKTGLRRVAVIGAGGHGREVADVFEHRAAQGDRVSVVGFIDEDPALAGSVINGLPVLGSWDWFKKPAHREVWVVCAVGTPFFCRKLALKAGSLGLRFTEAVSPLAYVSPHARLGKGVTLFAHSVVNVNARLGDHCILNLGASVSHDSVVGDYSILNPGARLAGNVTLGEGCSVGMQASVIQGLRVGAWTTLGAGAVVVRDLPSKVTAVGVPAKIIKRS